MDKTYRALSPYGKAVANASGCMQIVEGQRSLSALSIVVETLAPGIKNAMSRIVVNGGIGCLGHALADMMVKDRMFRQAVTKALVLYHERTGRRLRGDAV